MFRLRCYLCTSFTSKILTITYSLYKMRNRITNFIILMTLALSALGTSAMAQVSGNATFDINSSTLILDQKGNQIDFTTFIKLNPGSDYSQLLPHFDPSGQLGHIEIILLKPILKESNPIVSSDPNPSTHHSIDSGRPQSSSNTDGRFRFTTAEELKGKFAPYFDEKDVDGKSYSTSSLAGKVIVIKFWFLKCRPCLEEIPELNELARKFRNNPDVVFLAPATDEIPAVKRFLQRRQFGYTILPDSYNIHGDFKVAGYPTHLVINKSGNVGEVITGKNIRTYEILEDAIQRGLQMVSDDASMERFVGNLVYTSDKTIVAEEGYKLTEQEFIDKISTGEYTIYKRIKINGREEFLLVNINK